MSNLKQSSVSNVVEFPGANLGRIITINSELNDATFSFMNIGVGEQLLLKIFFLKTSIFEILYLLKFTLNFDRS